MSEVVQPVERIVQDPETSLALDGLTAQIAGDKFALPQSDLPATTDANEATRGGGEKQEWDGNFNWRFKR